MASNKKDVVTKVDHNDAENAGVTAPFVTFASGVGGTPPTPAPVVRQPEWAAAEKADVEEAQAVAAVHVPAPEDEDEKPVPKTDQTVTHQKARTGPPA